MKYLFQCETCKQFYSVDSTARSIGNFQEDVDISKEDRISCPGSHTRSEHTDGKEFAKIAEYKIEGLPGMDEVFISESKDYEQMIPVNYFCTGVLKKVFTANHIRQFHGKIWPTQVKDSNGKVHRLTKPI